MTELTVYADTLERECRRLHASFVEHRDELRPLVVKEVRQQIVPALTTPPRRQARVTSTPTPPPTRSSRWTTNGSSCT